jgi:hypothetical protein
MAVNVAIATVITANIRNALSVTSCALRSVIDAIPRGCRAILREFASGRKSEAPAPAAQQDKTVGRTELPHQPLKITSLRSFPP